MKYNFLAPIVLIFCCLSFSQAQNSDEIQVVNAGKGGNSSQDMLKRIDKDVISHRPDVVVLMVGANDMLWDRKFLSFDDYEDNIEQIIVKLKAVKSDIILLSSPPCVESLLFSRHSKDDFKGTSPNKKLIKAREIVKRIALENELPFVDINRIFDSIGNIGKSKECLLRNEANCGSADGVHATVEGYKIIATAVYQSMMDNDVTGARVVCFGDSITYGASMEGAGTATGQTYPAFLAKLLSKASDDAK
jgi:lysophospholipase L1-like esterase